MASKQNHKENHERDGENHLPEAEQARHAVLGRMRHCQHREGHKDHPDNQFSPPSRMKSRGPPPTAQHFQSTTQADPTPEITKHMNKIIRRSPNRF